MKRIFILIAILFVSDTKADNRASVSQRLAIKTNLAGPFSAHITFQLKKRFINFSIQNGRFNWLFGDKIGFKAIAADYRIELYSNAKKNRKVGLYIAPYYRYGVILNEKQKYKLNPYNVPNPIFEYRHHRHFLGAIAGFHIYKKRGLVIDLYGGAGIMAVGVLADKNNYDTSIGEAPLMTNKQYKTDIRTGICLGYSIK